MSDRAATDRPAGSLAGQVADRVCIGELAHAYAIALNHRDLEALCALFVDDVRVGSGRGHGALRASFEAQLRPLGRTILQVTNQLVTRVEGDAAEGIVGTRAEIELDGQWLVQVLEYHDTYARRGGAWRFVRRRHHLWYGAPLGTSPIGLPAANWPEHAQGTGELPWLLPSWQAWESGEAD